MNIGGSVYRLLSLPVCFLALFCLNIVPVQADRLDECRALSTLPDDVHNCMDNFLDLLDSDINEMEAFIVSALGSNSDGGSAQTQAFQRSQVAFREYRRENCLWYLEFSTPRSIAEQLAKNCLARMSQARLDELQSLVTEQSDRDVLRGYYVYGADRNSLQLCGDQKRYWVEGETSLVSRLQQDYLTQALTDLAVLYVAVTGQVDIAAGNPYPGHDGVFTLTEIDEIRSPKDGDCQLPSTIAPPTPVLDIAAAPSPQPAEPEAEPESETQTAPAVTSPVVSTDPEQVLKAYFGEWEAEYTQLGDSYGCVLTTVLAGGETEPSLNPSLRLTRRSGKRTIIDLEFPQREIDSTSRISWRVDNFAVGTIDSSRIRVDATATRQQLRERGFIQGKMLPLLVDGNQLFVEVRDEDDTLTNFSGTLLGLTRALSFADDFTQSDGRF